MSLSLPVPLSFTEEAQAVTSGPGHHFFGYYDKSCWDASGRWILGLRASFMDRPPRAGDKAIIGVIDTQQGYEWRPLAETEAWNWQQGCMLQWLGSSSDIIFNDVSEGAFCARVLNVTTGLERMIKRPVYALNRTGTHAVSLNFSRLHHQRPGYGYDGVPDPWQLADEPENDGLYSVDVNTGRSELILSIAEAADFQRRTEFDGKTHRFNHVQFGANPKRFAFLHRYKTPDEEVGKTRLMTMNLDGSDLRCLSDHGMVSHYDWRGDSAILAWANRNDVGARYFLFGDKTSEIEVVGESVFNCDGHCSFSPNGEWMLTDTYPDEADRRSLLLYHMHTGALHLLGRFHSPPMEWQIRCDLHPRWNRDGTQVCFDSVHEGKRKMYVLDVSELTTRA